MDRPPSGDGAKTLVRFGPYTLDADRRELRRDGKTVALRLQQLALLEHLIRNRDRIVPRDELRREVWEGAHVSDSAVDTALHRLRALLDDAGRPTCLEVVRGRGVRFAAEVREEIALRTPADFVARRPLLLSALRALERAREGAGALFLVEGDAGMGKSRGAHEIAKLAHDFAVARGYCEERVGSPPHWVFSQAFDALGRQGVHGANELAALLSDGSARPQSVRPSRVALFDAVFDRLSVAAEQQPLLLVLEDLHWADPASLALLEFLSPRLAQTRTVVLGAYRPETDPAQRAFVETMGRVLSQPETRVERLEALAPADVYQLVHVLRGMPATAHQVSALLERSRGNPFFLREFIADLEPGAGSIEGLPFGIQAALARRIAGLPREVSRALAYAALCGERFDPRWVAVAAGDTRKCDSPWLQPALDRGLLERDPTRADRVAFRHALLREALAVTLDDAECARAHRAVGELLEREHPEPGDEVLSRLAYHFAAALPAEVGPDRALHYAVRAAEAASQTHAFETAAAHAERAAGWLAALPATRERSELEVRVLLLASAAANAQIRTDAPEALAHAQRARELARGLGDHTAEACAALLSAVAELCGGHLRGAENALEDLDRHGATGDAVATDAVRAAVATFAGDFERADGAARSVERASFAARAGTARLGLDPIVLGLPVASLARWALGDDDGALARLAASRRDAETAGPFAAAYALFHTCLLHDLRRDAQELRERSAELDPLCAEHGIRAFLGSGQMFGALATYRAGDRARLPWELMAQVMRRLATTPDSPRLRSFKLFTAARFSAAHGDREQALTDAAAAGSAAAAESERFLLAEILRLEAELLLESGVPGRARERLEEAREIARGQHALVFELRASVGLARISRRDKRVRAEVAELAERLGPSLRGSDLDEARAVLA